MYNLIAANDLKELSKGLTVDDFDELLDDTIIPAVTKAFADYCCRPDFDLKTRTEYFSPCIEQRKLFIASPPIVPPVISIRTTALKWLLSSAGIRVYYVVLQSGATASITEPVGIRENGGEMYRGFSIATLAPGQFYFGDADSLGFNTLYVRLSDSSDPDTKDVGYLEHLAVGAVEVFEDPYFPRAYAPVTKLINGQDYFVDEPIGQVEKMVPWSAGPRTVKVNYRGGFLTAPATDVPSSLKLAATMQAKILFDRREEISLTSKSMEGGSIAMLTPLMLPKNVTMLIDPYRVFGR